MPPMIPNNHKARWAARKAAEIRRQARALPMVPSSDWRGVRARCEAIRRLETEAQRFEAIAARLAKAA